MPAKCRHPEGSLHDLISTFDGYIICWGCFHRCPEITVLQAVSGDDLEFEAPNDPQTAKDHRDIYFAPQASDQTPVWCNDVGSKDTFAKKGLPQYGIRENFAQANRRFAVTTLVASRHHGGPNVPPEVAVIFKGKKKDQVKAKRVQGRVYGSYRSEATGQLVSVSSESNVDGHA